MMEKMLRAGALLLLLVGVVACERTPDEALVREAVEESLRGAFPEPVVEVSSIKRLGSGPLPPEEGGADRKIVYYNAELALKQDYAFGEWEALNPAALANLLGASERGISGIKPGGNAAGDILRVRGSVGFVERADGWEPAVVTREPVIPPPPPDNTGPPAVARGLVEQILAMFEGPPGGDAAAARAIITDELRQAHQQITLRLDRLQRAFVIGGGSAGGEYDLVAGAMSAALRNDGLRSTAVSTEGSVENLRLVRDGQADVALAQNDVAAMAHRGEALFAQAGPAPSLRALASLFPEPVHVVVRADGPIRAMSDLRGKRVDLGLPASGSRLTALAVLDAHGLKPEVLAGVTDLGPARASEALEAGEVDALVSVINAPARLFQRLAARPGIRLLPLEPQAVERLTGGGGSLVALTLPPGTYPRQREPVPTVAVTALLIGREAMTDAEVRTALDAAFKEVDYLAVGSAAGAQISRRHAVTGLSIPMHPVAEAYFAEEISGPAAAR